jgi:2-oxoglutarate ferredoxin oxidoreductase subunit gamma
MDKFEETVKPGGTLLYDPNGISKHPTRKDINIYRVEGAKKAAEMGNTKIFNMIVLGAYLKIKPIVKMENVIKGIKKSLPERHHKLLPLNEDAVNQGTKIVEAVSVL